MADYETEGVIHHIVWLSEVKEPIHVKVIFKGIYHMGEILHLYMYDLIWMLVAF